MADKRSLDVPDLDLPPVSTARPASVRKVEVEAPPPSADEFDMELERGGAVVSQQPAASSRSSQVSIATERARPSQPRLPAASGLELTYRRPDAQPVVDQGPTTLAKMMAWGVPFLFAGGTVALLVKVLHRHGGRSVMALMPHAFDASSTAQSGAFALTVLGLSIALGFTGFRIEPRSYGMVGSATVLVLASLAMVTVTLVSLEEHPSPADGALLIPYLVPLAILLLGLGILGRGPSRFLGGGSGRATAALYGIAGGALGFVAIELSKLARLLP